MESEGCEEKADAGKKSVGSIPAGHQGSGILRYPVTSGEDPGISAHLTTSQRCR